MVRRHGSQSPVSSESTIGIFDAHVAFEEPAEFEGAEGDIPNAIVNFFEADLCSDADG